MSNVFKYFYVLVIFESIMMSNLVRDKTQSKTNIAW